MNDAAAATMGPGEEVFEFQFEFFPRELNSKNTPILTLTRFSEVYRVVMTKKQFEELRDYLESLYLIMERAEWRRIVDWEDYDGRPEIKGPIR